MRAGMPSLDGVASLLCESPEGRAIRGRSVRRSVSCGASLSALIGFYYNRFQACVAERRKRLTVDQDYLQSNTVGSNPSVGTKTFRSFRGATGRTRTLLNRFDERRKSLRQHQRLA
jgi:hypothetical protein